MTHLRGVAHGGGAALLEHGVVPGQLLGGELGVDPVVVVHCQVHLAACSTKGSDPGIQWAVSLGGG